MKSLMALMCACVVGLNAQGGTQPGGNPGRDRGLVRTLRFAVHYKSIEPQTITIPEGPYDIDISAGVIESAVDYQLEEAGKTEKRIEPKARGKYRKLIPVDLKPGTYTLTVKDHGDRWRSVIVVTKK